MDGLFIPSSTLASSFLVSYCSYSLVNFDQIFDKKNLIDEGIYFLFYILLTQIYVEPKFTVVHQIPKMQSNVLCKLHLKNSL